MLNTICLKKSFKGTGAEQVVTLEILLILLTLALWRSDHSTINLFIKFQLFSSIIYQYLCGHNFLDDRNLFKNVRQSSWKGKARQGKARQDNLMNL